MQIKAYLFSKNQSSFLSSFLSNYNFVFISLYEIKELNEPAWIFFGNGQRQRDVENFTKEIKGLTIPVVFYLPFFLKNLEVKKMIKNYFTPWI